MTTEYYYWFVVTVAENNPNSLCLGHPIHRCVTFFSICKARFWSSELSCFTHVGVHVFTHFISSRRRRRRCVHGDLFGGYARAIDAVLYCGYSSLCMHTERPSYGTNNAMCTQIQTQTDKRACACACLGRSGAALPVALLANLPNNGICVERCA